MSYIKDNLMRGEKILYSARVHPAIFIPTLITLIGTVVFILWALLENDPTGIAQSFSYFFAGFLLLFTARLGIQALIIMTSTEFVLTNKRILARTGFFRQRTLELLLHKVESVGVYQNLFGQIMNFGNVTVGERGGTKERFRAIIDPLTLRKKINKIIELYSQSNQ